MRTPEELAETVGWELDNMVLAGEDRFEAALRRYDQTTRRRFYESASAQERLDGIDWEIGITTASFVAGLRSSVGGTRLDHSTRSGPTPSCGSRCFSPNSSWGVLPGLPVPGQPGPDLAQRTRRLTQGRSALAGQSRKPTVKGVVARASPRTGRQGPPGQRPGAYDRTRRPGLCHRLCALRAHPQPYISEGQRTGAFRFGDVRAMALAGALCSVVHAVCGFTNKSLRGRVAGLLGADYTTGQMTYDLRRLRLHGLIERIPHTNTYRLTPDGQRVVVFYTKLQHRLLRPLLDAHQPPAPIEVRQALATIDKTINQYVTNARLGLPPETCHNVHSLNPQQS